MRAWGCGYGLQACRAALHTTLTITPALLLRRLATCRRDVCAASASGSAVMARRHAATAAATSAQPRIVQTVSAVLRQSGPLPLAKLSSRLADEDLEQIAEMRGGLMAFCHEHRDLFELESLPHGLRIVFHRSLLGKVAGRDRPAVRLAAALLVAAAHFPPAVSALPTPRPTVDNLLSVMRGVLDEQHCVGQAGATSATTSAPPAPRLESDYCYGMENVQRFRGLLQAYPTLFVLDTTSGVERVAMRCAAAAGPASVAATHVAASFAVTPSWAGHTHAAPETGRSPWTKTTLKGRQVYSLGGASVQRLECFVYAVVPVTFFVPLHFVLRQAHRFGRPVLDEPVTYDSLLSALSAMPRDAIDLRSFTTPAAAEAARREEATTTHYVRRLGVQMSGDTGAMPLRRAAEMDAMRYNVFGLGERIVAEMNEYVRKDSRNRLRLFKGVAMSELHTLLSPTLMRDLNCFFATQTTDEADGAGTPAGSATDPSTSVNTDLFLLVFDRLRHVFDVNFATATVRPWAVLPPAMQPSSLTSATTPLPLVLAAAQRIAETSPVDTEELYRQLPILAKMQLLALLVQASWCDMQKTEAIAHLPLATAVAALRQFIAHHSLFLFYRGTRVYTPRLAAEEAVPASYMSSKLRQKRMGHLYTRSAKAQMVFDAMPRRHPVAYYTLHTMPSMQALPFAIAALRPEFFRSFPALFKSYEPFASNILVYSRADVSPAPPPGVLQPRIDSLEAAIKFIALLSIGGMTDSTIMNRGSMEFRALMRGFGSCTQLVEQLPMWFEVRRDPYNVTGSVITYIGLYARDSDTSLRTTSDADLPPLPVVVNETLEPVAATQGKAHGGANDDDDDDGDKQMQAEDGAAEKDVG